VIRGPILTFWGGDGAEAEVRASEALLRAARPRAVQLHTWTPGPATDRVRAIVGHDVAIVAGFGVDGIARDVARGAHPVTRGVGTFVDLASRAAGLGAAAVVWNAEASWKRPPTGAEAARLGDLIRAALAEVAVRFPGLEQHHTAYDHPSFHSTYPWRPWLGEGSPVLASWPQVYAAPGGDLRAHRGALAAREARALSSWAAAIRAGWITPDDPSTPLREGVAWRPYYQLHHVPAVDTIRSALRHEGAMLWALRSRSDVEGQRAAQALCVLDRLGYWRENGVEAFQLDHGLVADNIAGPKTVDALLSM